MFRRKRYRNKIRVTFLVMFSLCLLTLGYSSLSQDLYVEGVVEAVEAVSLSSIIETGLNSGELVTENVGRSVSNDFMPKYYYKGTNPNNHLIFAGKCFRIVSISQNDTVKIIYDGNVSSAGDCSTISESSGLISNTYKYNGITDDLTSGVNNWFDNSSDSESLRKNFESFIVSGNVGGILLANSNLNNLANATWYVGAVNTNATQTLAEDIANELTNQGNTSLPLLSEVGSSEYAYVGKVGLLNITDYVKASSSSSCSSVYTGMSDDAPCRNNNYLIKNYPMITMNPTANTTNQIWAIDENGKIINDHLVYSKSYVRPVFYLNSGLNYSGNGTVSSPYVIV